MKQSLKKTPNTDIYPEFTLKALEKYRAEAHQRRENAGYAGEMSDDGCSQMLALAQAYETGLLKEIPEFLKGYNAQLKNESDPEYETYTRLKEKFEKQS